MTIIASILAIMLLRTYWKSFRNIQVIKSRWPIRGREAPYGWDALRGILPGAIVGALAYPIIPLALVYLYGFNFSNEDHTENLRTIPDLLEIIYEILRLIPVVVSAWCVAIALSTQVWSVLCWCGACSIWVAIILGTALSMLTGFALIGFNVVTSNQLIIEVLMGFAGGASGATVWWSAYRR